MPDLKTVTFDASQWQLVPKEPTQDMVTAGFESEPDEAFSEPKVWEAFEKLSGCQQAAHKATLCYRAMLEHAPTPAAQSAGQEAIYQLKCTQNDVTFWGDVTRETYEGHELVGDATMRRIVYRVPYATPVSVSEPVAWAVFDNEHLVATVIDLAARKAAESVGYTLRPLGFSGATPVNGGERVKYAPKPVPVNAAWTRHQSGDSEWWSYGRWQARKHGDRKHGDKWVLTHNGDEFARDEYLSVVMRRASEPNVGADPQQSFLGKWSDTIKQMPMGGADAQQVGGDDRRVLYAILDHLNDSVAVCEQCHHSEPTSDMDVTSDLRAYLNGQDSWLAKTAALTSPAKVGGDEREAFEREYADHGDSAFVRVGESYTSPVTNALWMGWQARAALSADGGEALTITDEMAEAWAVRHDIEDTLINAAQRRSAIEDARTIEHAFDDAAIAAKAKGE
ncbi:hypothetical protein [Pandoraea apista]|uniref:Uncharacterized protein n=1 Tax=Pandoraea apista TaxID=93218 RepID=A0ABX9ZKE9_9BURK|nr:hypothetical protein [Pandoraea apista]PTE00836.1 hypothetical protein C7830_11405 [Pandoraea apista]RRJ30798.1 hypothetical protein EIB05_13535 [Pandoraea apista]RRJ74574.1 hypothetical protein EIL82_15065 [Pandoraea apista]RSD06390.1 hypothetical protein EJB12_21905 [Pandoraea apista]RSD14543.1 hypothetical protein EIZ52_18085 [Pandoraea apista]